MHDAPDLFDITTSFSGEWEVDESLNDLFQQGDYGCIVVGIDNGGVNRLDECSPWVNTDENEGRERAEPMSILSSTHSSRLSIRVTARCPGASLPASWAAAWAD